MNQRNYPRALAFIAAIALAMTLFLPGCGGSSNNIVGSSAGSKNFSASSMAPQAPAAPAPSESFSNATSGFYGEYDTYAQEEAAEAPVGEAAAGDAPQFVMPDTRKIIRHVSMDLETREFASALRSIQQTVADAGGYIESQSQDGYSLGSRSRYQERYASIQARIPSARLDEAVRSVGGFCNVLSQSENMDDITESYFDSQARLSSLKIQEERLLAILEKAEKLEDVITLENALSDVRYQIESLTASIRRMDSQVAYSYLNISLREVVEYQEILEKPQTFGERIRDAFGDGVGDMVEGLQELAIWLARVGPSLVVFLLIVLVIVFIIRACARASAKRREAKGLPPRGQQTTGWYGTTTGGTTAHTFQRYPQPPAGVQGQQPPQPVQAAPVPQSQEPEQDGEKRE